MEIIKFGARNIENILSKKNAKEIDDLAFGAIKLDRHGNVVVYNAAEGEITGRNPEEVIGKNFFEDVAPCTKSPEFYGKFQEGVKTGELDTLFEYTFDYHMAPTKVKVHMKKALVGDYYWIFVKRMSLA
ncbi:photoactive yellow protein [candidate division KSB3 bacterium]|uniref:Photoactive yellow protein n=1 Tax=candidate division KSB3 bacterium TaxID=2044937 RepID=A0A9D5Q6P9_9BACT|nr:photoactive yellow protein [candidate division KSB3 bacterium]MBD3325588.1 photoactive yellow protein [candidate division KSB3 bacterium]